MTHYEGNELLKVLTEHKKTFCYPSYDSSLMLNRTQEAAFNAISRLYLRAKDLESFSKPDLALDYYIHILLTYSPLGCVYYERPAILLEKKHDFKSALAVCELAMQMQPFQREQEREGYEPEYAKRMARLHQKIACEESKSITTTR